MALVPTLGRRINLIWFRLDTWCTNTWYAYQVMVPYQVALPSVGTIRHKTIKIIEKTLKNEKSTFWGGPPGPPYHVPTRARYPMYPMYPTKKNNSVRWLVGVEDCSEQVTNIKVLDHGCFFVAQINCRSLGIKPNRFHTRYIECEMCFRGWGYVLVRRWSHNIRNIAVCAANVESRWQLLKTCLKTNQKKIGSHLDGFLSDRMRLIIDFFLTTRSVFLKS